MTCRGGALGRSVAKEEPWHLPGCKNPRQLRDSPNTTQLLSGSLEFRFEMFPHHSSGKPCTAALSTQVRAVGAQEEGRCEECPEPWTPLGFPTLVIPAPRSFLSSAFSQHTHTHTHTHTLTHTHSHTPYPGVIAPGSSGEFWQKEQQADNGSLFTPPPLGPSSREEVATASSFSTLLWLLAESFYPGPPSPPGYPCPTSHNAIRFLEMAICFPFFQDNAACELIPCLFTGATNKGMFPPVLCCGLLL